MSNHSHFSPLKTGLLIGASIGLAAGISSTIWVKKRQTKNPQQVLEGIKHSFLAEGPIEGSWIEHEPVFVDHIVQETKAYSGGIVRYEEDALVVYEFLADAHSGTILNISQLEGN
ncbi:hypothetical protein ACYSNO_06930 [Enterococcus sp. LJL98]